MCHVSSGIWYNISYIMSTWDLFDINYTYARALRPVALGLKALGLKERYM